MPEQTPPASSEPQPLTPEPIMPIRKDEDNEEEASHDATLMTADQNDDKAKDSPSKPVFESPLQAKTSAQLDASADAQKSIAPPMETNKVDAPAPAESTAASPVQRLSEELLALFDADLPAGDRKAAAAAIIKTITDVTGNTRVKPDGDKPLHASTRVENRSRFIPVMPKLDEIAAAGPRSTYDALKRPNS